MRQIFKVQPLPIEIVAKVSKLEVSMAAAQAEAAKLEKLYRETINSLCKIYDPNYEANSKSSVSLYAAEIKDGCLVITKD